MLAMIFKIPKEGTFHIRGQVCAFYKEMTPRVSFHHLIVPLSPHFRVREGHPFCLSLLFSSPMYQVKCVWMCFSSQI